jgi:vacuolar-type H+-ATPase subunit I/STV1
LSKVTVGVKAGVVSGAIYGAIIAPITYITLIFLKEEIMPSIIASLPDSPITAEQAYNIMLLIGPIFAFITGIILGLIFGIIYGWAYDKIPGRTSIIKGIIFGIILWLIFSVLLGAGNLQYSISYYLYGLGEGLITSLIFGLLLGFFYNKFIPKIAG